jgi:hypothetical protein
VRLTTLRFVVGAVIATVGAVSLAAQVAGRGSLSGLVTDATGAVVPAASVTLTNVATGVALKGKTSGAGLYSFVSLVPGSYRLEVSQAGFQTMVQDHIAIAVDQAETVNVALKLGSQTETVTVSAAEDITATTSSTTGQLITSDVIDRLPLSARDVFQLAMLSPGVIPQDGNINSIDTGRDQVSIFTINGAQQGTIYYILDGSPLTIGENNQGVVIPALEPPEDSVEEFRMELNATPASVQTGAAGVISLVSKSGTDSFHGDAFAWIQPNGLDANTYFNNLNGVPIPDFHRYQWGGSFGGPIKKDKFFFFGDYEGTQESSGTSLTTTVPTAAEKGGDFSGDVSGGSSVTIYNPFNFGNANCSGSPAPCPQPFPNNNVQGYINPIAQKYLQYWPSPNITGQGMYHTNNFYAAGSSPETDQRFDIRLDDSITTAQHLFGRVSIHRENNTSPNFFHNNFFAASSNFDHDGNLAIGYDWTLSPNTVLQLRTSGTRHYEDDVPAGQLGYNMTQLGFAQSLASSSVLPSIPYMAFSGCGGGSTCDNGSVYGLGLPGFAVFKFAVTNYDTSVTLNKVLGRHNLSFGWDFQKQFMNVGQTLAPDGAYLFAPDATSNDAVNGGGGGDGDSFASFLIGVGSLNQSNLPGIPNWSTDIFGANSNPYSALFIQDDWHATQKLTINAGLRWDVFPGATERFNRMEYFDPTLAYSVNGVNLTGGEVFSSNAHRSPFVANFRDFAPRFGLTYQVTPHAVVRGGFGISYGPSVHMSSINQFNDDSFNAETTWLASQPDSSDTYAVPVNTLSNPFPNGIVEPTKGSLGAETNLGLGLNFVPHIAPDMTTYNFNFGVQYEFAHETILSVAWVGSRGLHLTFSNNAPDLNQLPLQQIAQNGNNLLNMVPYPDANAITSPDAPWYGATMVPQFVTLEEYPQFSYGNPEAGSGVLDWGDTLGDSIYHSLQAKLEKRLSHGFTTLASFTWGKLLNNDDSGSLAFSGNNLAVPQDFKNLNLERALSTQDIALFFTWELSYDLPIGANRLVNLHGWTDEALGGWTLSTVTTFGDGQPLATPNGTLDPFFNQRPNIASNNCASGAPKNINEWFNYTCLSEPTNQFAPGTAGPILPGIRADGTHNLDLSLAKHFKFGEHRDLMVRAETYNLTNSVQFGYPNIFWSPENFGQQPNDSDQAGFGQITNQANNPRLMSFEARFTF